MPVEAHVLDVDFTHTSVYSELRAHCGRSPEEGRERIKPVVPDPIRAGYLELGPGEPAFEVERHSLAHDEPLEWRITLIRGDRYNFLAEWKAEDTVVVPRLVAG